ncbi:MAG: tyrosine-type recombinase/integrase [Firmicutes bacterium]|nr:tyrosine-type recombinase/integrase [Bacillota bacterium]
MSNYFLDRDAKNIERQKEIIKQLPKFVNEFFVGVSLKTSALTRLNYAYDLRIFFDFLSKETLKKNVLNIELKDLENISAFDIELFLEHLSNYKFNGKNLKATAAGKERKLSAIRSFFKYYFKKDKIEKNVAAKVDMPKINEKGIIRLEPNEVANLLDKIDGDLVDGFSNKQNQLHHKLKIRDSAIVTLFLGTGIRISELIGLNVEDIHFESNSFNVTRKGGSNSTLYFTDEIALALKNYLNYLRKEIVNKTVFGLKLIDYGYDKKYALFLSLQGTRITVRAAQNMVKKYSSLVTAKKITPHKLRSTFGTELYKNTQDIYVVADVLGHKDVNTTKKHYAAISDEIRKNAARTVKLRDDD